MGSRSAIEWTDATWNPQRGCTPISPGCRNCYAAGIAARFSGPGLPYEGLAKMVHGVPHWTGEVRAIPDKLDEPFHWRAGRRIFVNSTSDLFHEAATDDAIDQVLARMLLLPRHTFQVLTKRASRMRAYFNGPTLYARILRVVDGLRQAAKTERARNDLYNVGVADPRARLPRHIWLGVSVESQKYEERIQHLLETPAAVHFLSCEPLLGPLDIEDYLVPGLSAESAARAASCSPAVAWVIAGGESGADARPMHPAWARSLRDQCARRGVPFFFKQWGAWVPRERDDGKPFDSLKTERHALVDVNGLTNACHESAGEGAALMSRVKKEAAGAVLDGVEHHAFPFVGAGLRALGVGDELPVEERGGR